MSELDQESFDANERIAGFSLLNIRDAIRLVGITDDRDDVKHVSTVLKCGRDQAQHVLEYALHGDRTRRAPRRDASSRSWTFSQREADCSCGGSGGGTVMSPISTASSLSGMRARVAPQYFGASSR